MIESLKQIEVASSSWWRWLLWFPRWRRLTQELVRDLQQCREFKIHKEVLEGQLAVKTAEVNALQGLNQSLQKDNEKHADAILHLTRWIQATHRVTREPEPGTIKALLYNAQRQ